MIITGQKWEELGVLKVDGVEEMEPWFIFIFLNF